MDHFSTFFPAICAGLGLFLAGTANLVLLRRSFAIRAGATVAAIGASLAIAAQLEPAQTLVRTAQLLALAMIPCVLLASGRLIRALSALVDAIGRPVVRHASLTILGVGVAIGSVIVFERTDQRLHDQTTIDLDEIHSRTATAPSILEKAVTDCGTQIALHESTSPRDSQQLSEAEARSFANSGLKEMVIRFAPADDRANCHGWVFTGGRYHLRGNDVALILGENSYREESRPQLGDLVIYRMSGGSITHSGVVQYITDGEPVLVRSKWGNLGVFTHPVDQSPYGTAFGYYRSPRPGHLLSISPRSSGEIAPTTRSE